MALLLLIGWAAWGINQAEERKDPVSRLQETLGGVTTLDAATTRYARMAAVSGSLDGERRYREMEGLIDEVLDIARADSGQMELPSEPVPVGEAADYVLSLVRPLASQSRVALPPGASGDV